MSPAGPVGSDELLWEDDGNELGPHPSALTEEKSEF